MELLDYEKRHIEYLEKNASECTLFLKKNDEFPLTKPCKLCLVGNGARNTIKGGTGSGDVESRFFLSFEQGLKKDGFEITSTKWMDDYDAFKKTIKKDYIKGAKKEAKKHHVIPCVYTMGYFDLERDYNFSCDYEGDACVYVLARNSGEGNDRKNESGDVKLSKKEIEDILFLNNKFKKFMLVLNVGGVVDLSPVINVSNILYISQLGVVTGTILSSILLGKQNPSGKLSSTWTKSEDYPFFNEFGDMHDTYYKEGIYVGYRYFSSMNKEVLFPFGFGKSYTDFELNVKSFNVNKTQVEVIVNVKNIGKYAGKEVLQAYISKPNDEIDNPYIELVGYTKTSLLAPLSDEDYKLEFDLCSFTTFDESRALSLLLKGEYVVRVGNSSTSLIPVLKIKLDEEVIVEKLENKMGKANFKDFVPSSRKEEKLDIPSITLDISSIKERKVEYKKDKYVDPLISKLTNEELASICLGHYDNGLAAIIGVSCKNVIGGAGETVLKLPQIKHSLTMADGPAGIRIKQEYIVNKKGVYDTKVDPMMEKMLDFLPKAAGLFLKPKKNVKGELKHQYTTAIPIGTALCQSFNNEFVEECGKMVQEEMEIFGVDLWLAPALNIHRNILCGRNFEYYSEDPFLSGSIASSMAKGVENKERGVTIKHFACNNQELNRTNNNSHISERALREIYLKGFQICIKNTHPKAIMTSYNLINGTHTSESYELINDILRCEWEYEGLVMTDWVASGRNFARNCKYEPTYASRNVKSGNDLTMPGCKKDFKDIMNALKKGFITRDDLICSASRIYRSIEKQKN